MAREEDHDRQAASSTRACVSTRRTTRFINSPGRVSPRLRAIPTARKHLRRPSTVTLFTRKYVDLLWLCAALLASFFFHRTTPRMAGCQRPATLLAENLSDFGRAAGRWIETRAIVRRASHHARHATATRPQNYLLTKGPSSASPLAISLLRIRRACYRRSRTISRDRSARGARFLFGLRSPLRAAFIERKLPEMPTGSPRFTNITCPDGAREERGSLAGHAGTWINTLGG